jgi:hypothetical protein
MASSSSRSQAQEDVDGIPEELIRAVNDARPQCPFWGTKRGCRKGQSCSLRHATSNELHLPHVSRHRAADGSTVINLRPPLMQGLERYFRHLGVLMPLTHGESWHTDDSISLITYATKLMLGPKLRSCAEAEQRGGVDIGGSFRGKTTGEFPQLLLHGTSVENASWPLQHISRNCWGRHICFPCSWPREV